MRYSTAARHAHGLASRSGEVRPPRRRRRHTSSIGCPRHRRAASRRAISRSPTYNMMTRGITHAALVDRRGPEEAQNRLPPARSASSTRVRTHGPRGARTSEITYLTTGTRTRTRTRADAPTPPRRARDLQTKRAVHIAAARRFDAPSPCRGRSEVGRPKEPMMIHPPTNCPSETARRAASA